MSAFNGSTVSVPEQSAPQSAPKKYDPDAYRPTADRMKVHEAVTASLSEVVSEALRQASGYVSLASFYDRKESTATRHRHLVDAAECMEIAFSYLGLVKQELAHLMNTEDDDTDLGSSADL